MSASYGIVGIGRAFGDRYSVEDLVNTRYAEHIEKIKGWGYKQFFMAPPEVDNTDLAQRAVEDVLQQTGVRAEELDLIIYAATELPEYLYGDQSAELQRRLGAFNAEVLLVSHACASAVMAMDIVAGKFATNPEYKTAVLVGVNRTCETYLNRMQRNACLHSDGASALLVKRDHPHGKWLATKTLTDGTYCSMFRLEWGGTANPFTAENLEYLKEFYGLNKVQEFFAGDVNKLLAFIDLLNRRNREVVEMACAKAGLTLSDLSRVIFLHDNVKSFKELAKEFEIPLENTNMELSFQYGHMGGADQFMSLKHLMDAGELTAGETVALVALGTGMIWTCSLIQI